MNPVKQLFGQTAVYGFGTVVPRLLNYVILTPLFTRIFNPSEYGVVTELYAYVVFLMIILTYGMETGFFRFSQNKDNEMHVYSTSLLSLFFTSGIFIALVWFFSLDIADFIGYKEHPEYIIWIGLIVGIDAFTAIPFAQLRWQNKAGLFAAIKICSVLVNIILNFFLLYYLPERIERGDVFWLSKFYNTQTGVGYVFLSNLAASIFTLLLLSGTIIRMKPAFNRELHKKMIFYSFPLLISGLAGTVNEAIDRIMLRHMLPIESNPLEQLGIYGANYKIAVLMTLFVQMFRFAAEPFYFARANQENAAELFAGVMKYFVIITLFLFLLVVLYIDLFKHFIGSGFRGGLHIVPIVLFANLLLGVFFNLSVWYKLKNLTRYGAYITISGAFITFLINYLFIPKYGYIASAWAHLICYFCMVVISWRIGKKYYPLPYQINRILFYVILAGSIYTITRLIQTNSQFYSVVLNSFLLLLFIIIVFFNERKEFERLSAAA